MSRRGAIRDLLKGLAALSVAAIAVPAVPARGQVGPLPHAPVRTAQVAEAAAPPSGRTDLPRSSDAQGGVGPVQVKLRPNPSLPGWTKICDKDPVGTEVCYTTLDFISDEDKPVLAVALYETRSGPQTGAKIARFMLPTALLLQQGMRFAVDGKEWIQGRYRICLPNGCVAESPVKDEAGFAKGTNLTVSVLNGEGREVAFTLPLAGFAKAYDGPPISAEGLRQQQETFLKDAERRGRELMGRSPQGAGNPPGDAAAKR